MVVDRTLFARTPARHCSHYLPFVLERGDAVCQYKFVDLMFIIYKLSRDPARTISKKSEPGSQPEDSCFGDCLDLVDFLEDRVVDRAIDTDQGDRFRAARCFSTA